MFLTSLICVALICNVFAQELIDEFTFTGFTGAGFAPAGVSGRLDSNSTRVFLNTGEKTEYGDSRSGSSFANGLVKYVDRKTYSVQGGIGAIELSNETTPNVALHLQPAGSDFSPGYVEFRFPFDKAADSDVNIVVTVFFDFWYFNRQPRGSKWSLLYATGNKTGPGTFTTLPSGYFETPHEAGSLTSDWEKQTLELEYGTVLPKAHDYFYLRFEGDDLEGSSGGRDPIALDNVGVIAHTCELGEANCKCKATSPKCDGDFECDASSTCSRGGCTSGNGLGCPCANSTRACDTDLQCTPPNTSINVCTPGGCLPGAPECICLNNGKCQETNCGTDKPGFCDPVKCPATNALLEAECKEKCPNGHTRCLCFGGERNITCATAATTAVTTAASGSTTSQSGSNSATTTGSAGTATNTPYSYSGTTGFTVTTTTTESTTMTTEPALDCGASTCAQCLETVGCGYCGDQFVGICGDLSKALSCQFKPLENKADCPVVEPPATPTPPSPTTTSGATVSSTTAEESIATLNSIAFSAMFLLLATLFF